MTLQMFRSLSSLQTLSREVEDNLERYRCGDFAEKLATHKLLSVQDDFSTSFFASLKKTNNVADDYDNAILLWDNLSNAQISERGQALVLSNSRSWVEYCRARYPLDKGHESDVKNIERTF